MCMHTQVWNHPWVLKLDEQRQNKRAERLATYGESDDSLGVFIVSGSEEEEVRKRKTKKKKKKKVVMDFQLVPVKCKIYRFYM